MHNQQNIMFPIKLTKTSKEKLEILHFRCNFAHIRPISLSKYINRLTIHKPNVKSKLPRTGYYGNFLYLHTEIYSILDFRGYKKVPYIIVNIIKSRSYYIISISFVISLFNKGYVVDGTLHKV